MGVWCAGARGGLALAGLWINHFAPLRLTGGLRYTYEDKRGSYDQTQVGARSLASLPASSVPQSFPALTIAAHCFARP